MKTTGLLSILSIALFSLLLSQISTSILAHERASSYTIGARNIVVQIKQARTRPRATGGGVGRGRPNSSAIGEKLSLSVKAYSLLGFLVFFALF